MKFTKEDARKELMSKIPNKGQTLNLSERSIDEMLETLMTSLANDETEMNVFIDSVLPIFKTADGNVKNDVSVGITKYKEENPIKTVEPTKEGVIEDEKLSAYIKKVEDLEARLAKEDENRKISDIKKNLTAKLKEKGVKDVEWINSFIGEVNITTDFNVDEKVDAYVQIYNKSKAITPPNITPKGGGGSADVNKYIDDIIAAAAQS